ncbi:MAG: patatin-like phospholipase family protein [Nitrosopumilus sp.]|nr:patatin-like phospholipase family protein [Nitrosopumilus sp.]
MTDDIPEKQRALVFQGGGALGAYEAGVFKGLYSKLFKPGEPLFDIVVGTSIGAINAAILVSHVKENKTWEDSEKILETFWTNVSSNPAFTRMWLDSWYSWNKFNSNAPSKEAARRYFATREYLHYGAPGVFSPPTQIRDDKFLDSAYNTWYRYDNQPLKDSIKNLVNFPISTNYTDKEPRLLLTSVDVQEGMMVTFDSFQYIGNECRICEEKIKDNENSNQQLNKKLVKHVYENHLEIPYSEGDVLRWSAYKTNQGKVIPIYYNDGLGLEHVIASASVPVYYDYAKIKSGKPPTKEDSGNELDVHYFWDGGILSNTPLRELIAGHRFYWENKIGSETLEKDLWRIDESDAIKVPDLEVYVVNIWPTREKQIPMDRDGTVDRKNDIIYHDKTHYDEKVAHQVTDYIGLIKHLIKLAKKKQASKAELENVLKIITESTQNIEDKKEYAHLLQGRFNVSVKRIERVDDEHTISNKWVDFTKDSIDELMLKGYEQCIDTIK